MVFSIRSFNNFYYNYLHEYKCVNYSYILKLIFDIDIIKRLYTDYMEKSYYYRNQMVSKKVKINFNTKIMLRDSFY